MRTLPEFLNREYEAPLLGSAGNPVMKQSQLSAAKRFGKPVLFGTILVGLASAFLNRHKFFPDVDEVRARERAEYNEKLLDVVERRQRQMDQLAQKKPPSG